MSTYTVGQSAALGVVQGLTEFLPVSSSAHLVLVPWFCGWPNPANQQAFDVALHIGTVFATLMFFFTDWLKIIASYIGDFRMKNYLGGKTGSLLPKVIVSTLPGAILGKLFEKRIEETFYHDLGNVWVLACTMFVFGAALVLAERRGSHSREVETITYRDALIIGAFQALALVPGTSRSGITILGGLLLGLKRPAAARFSFLAAMPITLGAVILKLKDLQGAESWTPLVVGIVTSAVVGMIAIGGLLRYVQNRSYKVFAVYRWILAMAILAVFFGRGGSVAARAAQTTGDAKAATAVTTGTLAPSAAEARPK